MHQFMAILMVINQGILGISIYSLAVGSNDYNCDWNDERSSDKQLLFGFWNLTKSTHGVSIPLLTLRSIPDRGIWTVNY